MLLSFNCLYCQTENKDLDILIDLEKKGHTKKINYSKSLVTNNYDNIYNRCYWKIDPFVNYIAGNITSYFKPTSANFSQIEFDLSSSLTVDSIKYHQTLVSFIHDDFDLLKINLNTIIAINQIDSLTIYYQGLPQNGNSETFIQEIHDNYPIIWTKSEPYGAKDWWPCKQNLNDKVDSLDIYVEIPFGNKVASNGKLIEIISNSNSNTYHWKSLYPIAAYLVAIGVTNYTEFSQYVVHPSITYEVLNYVYPETLDTALVHTLEIIDILNLYDSLTIIYPFAAEKYGHAQFGWGGGMEHQTMSFMINFDFGLMAHECAHQWFGDYITCGSWEDIWLNEGFATFFEGLAQQKLHPENWYNWRYFKKNNITSKSYGTVFCDDTTNISRIFDGRLTYNKGAYILHMLRWKLGDSLFFNALTNYLNDPTLKYNYAKTQSLITHLEVTSGQDLTSFFDKWFYKQGYPTYEVIWNKKNDLLNLQINQVTSDPSVLFYEMPVPIKIIGEFMDTTIILNHLYSGQIFTTSIPFPIKEIQFDPEMWILSRNNLVINSNTDYTNPFQINIFPNPSSDVLSIESHNTSSSINKIEIFDLNGNLVYYESVTDSISTIKTIDIKKLDTSIYNLKIYTMNEVVNFQFLKN